jgi:hypothetical protein
LWKLGGLITKRAKLLTATFVHEILSLALSKEASDARDLVYGILGLIKDEERIRIPVDYGTTTPMDVFKQAFEVIWASDNPRSLEVLDEFLFCQPDDGEEGGPSWVMDMRQDAMERYKMTGLYLRNPQGFQAKQAVQVLAEGKILQVKGIYIDAIESVEFIDEDDFEYFAREMYADMSRKARAAQEQPIPNDHHLYDLDEIKQVGSIDNTFAGGADSNCVLIDSIVANRSLFTTPAGLYGIGHPEIEVGDHIVFIYGMRVPLVLRPMSGHYKIVGPARVSGFTKPFILDALHSSGHFNTIETDFKLG